MSAAKRAPQCVSCWCGARIEEPSNEQAETFMRFHEITCSEDED